MQQAIADALILLVILRLAETRMGSYQVRHSKRRGDEAREGGRELVMDIGPTLREFFPKPSACLYYYHLNSCFASIRRDLLMPKSCAKDSNSSRQAPGLSAGLNTAISRIREHLQRFTQNYVSTKDSSCFCIYWFVARS
jgi:hypothetical protein